MPTLSTRSAPPATLAFTVAAPDEAESVAARLNNAASTVWVVALGGGEE